MLKDRKKIKKEQIESEEQDISFDKNIIDLRDLFVPDAFVEEKDYVYLGSENYARILAVSVYPSMVHIGWLDDLFSIEGVSVSEQIEPVPDFKSAKILNKKLKEVNSEIYTKEKYGDSNHIMELYAMRDDLMSELINIQRNVDKMFYVTIFVKIRARNDHELEEKTALVEEVFQKKFAHIRTLSLQQLEGLKSMLPTGEIYINEFKRNMTAGGIASLFPVSNPDLTHPDGIYLGKNYFTGSPVFINNFAYPARLNNPHVSIFGISGSGKSVGLKHMLAMYSLLGKRIAVIDPEGEYKGLIKDMLDGEYVNIRAGNPSGMNLFDLEIDMDDNGREIVDIMTKQSEIRALLNVVSLNFNGRPLTGLEISAIDQTVNELYHERNITQNPESLYETGGKQVDGKFIIGKVKKKMPTLSDFQKKLSQKKNGEEIAEILIPFLRGHSMGIFDCETTIDITSHAIGFNLFDIKDEFLKLFANYVISTWIAQNFMQKYHDVDKIVANDETWMFVRYADTAKFLNDLARRGRKHHTMLVIASQFIDEFLSNSDGEAVIKSCATNIIMRQHPGAVDKTIEFFHLSDGTRTLLETFNPGECILSLNGNVTAIKTEPIPYEWAYIKT